MRRTLSIPSVMGTEGFGTGGEVQEDRVSADLPARPYRRLVPCLTLPARPYHKPIFIRPPMTPPG